VNQLHNLRRRRALISLLLLLTTGCDRSSGPADAADDASAAIESRDDRAPRRAPAQFAEHHDDVLAAFRHDPGFLGNYRLQEIMGSGAALFDFDNDGRLDIYLVNGDRARAPADDLARGDRLLRQRDDGSFEDVTAQSGVRPHGFGMGTATGDYDNDGDLDLLLTGVGQLQLFRNNGDGTLTDVSEHVGIADQPWCVAAAFADFDRDGWLDLFVVNYVQPDDHQKCFDKSGRREFCGPQHYQPLADVLYRNDEGTFRDVSRESGIGSKRGPGLGVMCIDFTGDQLIDIYVANDAAANFLWINQGDGTFIERAAQLGGAYSREGAAEASMGVTVGDVNDDGGLDLFMTHLDSETNTLYRVSDDGTFVDVTALTGLGPPSLPFTGFGTAMLDADLDGDLDIVVVNGAIKRRQRPFAGAVGIEGLRPYAEPRQLYINDGSGRFEAFAGDEAGLGPIEVGRGMAVGDMNNDGALDLLISSAGSGARLLLGEPQRRGHWLQIRAYDASLKRDALGALVTVRVDEKRLQRHVLTSYSYASSNEPVAHFGLGVAETVDEIVVRWPDGDVERFPGTASNTRLELLRGEGEPLIE
jgi:hypothetical protein